MILKVVWSHFRNIFTTEFTFSIRKKAGLLTGIEITNHNKQIINKFHTTTIKQTDNYRNNRTTYKPNSGLFFRHSLSRYYFGNSPALRVLFPRTKYFEILPTNKPKLEKSQFSHPPRDENDRLKNEKSYLNRLNIVLN